MRNEIKQIEKSVKESIAAAGSLEKLEEIRIQCLGRRGALKAILRSLKNLPEKERKETGNAANQLRQEIERWFARKEQRLKSIEYEKILDKERIDVTRPAKKIERGHLHPITKLRNEIEEIFGSMGFETIEGPEVENEWYNFDALNIPEWHPAREMWDTLWLRNIQRETLNPKPETLNKSKIQNSKSQRLLLRTHTSPVQVRYMEKHNPPIRIIVPGRVYRREATDASHDIQFWQVEGLMVDRHTSLVNFKAIIQEFFSRLFKTKIAIRLRPSYFPFTEPSFEVDISCITCGAKGCSICRKSGWLELAGAGMVHPKVFESAGYNPQGLQGFAFGMGIDRLAMMKYKIPDIRLFRSGDLRFLKQF